MLLVGYQVMVPACVRSSAGREDAVQGMGMPVMYVDAPVARSQSEGHHRLIAETEVELLTHYRSTPDLAGADCVSEPSLGRSTLTFKLSHRTCGGCYRLIRM